MTRPAPIVAGTLAAVVLLFGAYMGSYYILLERASVNDNPAYRGKGGAARTILRPAHKLDRLIRPGYWGDE